MNEWMGEDGVNEEGRKEGGKGARGATGTKDPKAEMDWNGIQQTLLLL